MGKKLKIDPEKLKKAVNGMEAKAKELGWSPSMPAEESQAAIREPKFVSVKLGNVWGPWKRRGGRGNDGGFTLEWGAEKVGFGEITFCVKDGKVICDTECMSQRFVRAAMAHFLSTQVVYDPKQEPLK